MAKKAKTSSSVPVARPAVYPVREMLAKASWETLVEHCLAVARRNSGFHPTGGVERVENWKPGARFHPQVELKIVSAAAAQFLKQ